MKRQVNSDIRCKLQGENLWINHLKEDCKKGNVFMAIRDNKIDFYHNGGRLFNYDKNGFKTHIKYAAVIERNGKDYLTETELEKCRLSNKFSSNYERIKENCSIYSGTEATGVSSLYSKYSYTSQNNVVVLDIETSLKAQNEESFQDRIDIVIFNKTKRIIQFVEAKSYSNKELWSKNKPSVINQIERYENQIRSKKKEILKAYQNYVRTIKLIFDIELSEPIEIDEQVTLLIFGFDDDQKAGRLKSKIIGSEYFKNIKIYAKGKISDIRIDNLWK